MKITDCRDGHVEPKDAYQKAVEMAISECILYAAGPQTPRSWWKIGNGLDRLKPEEKEAVKDLKSADVMNIRFP